METVKEVVAWFGIFGIPTIFTMVTWCVTHVKKYNKNMKILMKAVQAQMRSNLLKQYYLAKDRGYITSDDLDDWENLYQSYHSLGSNGVLDKRREELLAMPNKIEE